MALLILDTHAHGHTLSLACTYSKC